MLLALKGPGLPQVKGILNIAELGGPLVNHGVQHVFHLPLQMKEWPSKDRRTRIAFITRDIDEGALRDTLKMFTGNPPVAAAAS